jgi:hypothetical protein
VGKSTLVAALGREFSRLGLRPCTVHEKLGQTIQAKGLPLGQHADASTVMEFARAHVRRERHLGGGIHVLDRCFVDLLAYAITVCGDQTILIELVRELALASMFRVDLVVRVPMISALAENRSPNESSEFRRRIDGVITRILPSLTANFIEVNGTTTDERAQQIISTLGGRLNL